MPRVSPEARQLKMAHSMTDAELKSNIDVLSAAIACIAVEARKAAAVSDALKSLAKEKPEAQSAADGLLAALTSARMAQEAAGLAGLLRSGGFPGL